MCESVYLWAMLYKLERKPEEIERKKRIKNFRTAIFIFSR